MGDVGLTGLFLLAFIRYVEVSTLCPDHLALVRPTADALAVSPRPLWTC